MKKYYFLDFEGIDGAGKDYHSINVQHYIKSHDFIFGDKYSNIWLTREPTKITDSGKEISRLIKERNVSKKEALDYYIQDRKEHTRIIEYQLTHSDVISSRYDFSTFSYQIIQCLSKDFFDGLMNNSKYFNNGSLIPNLNYKDIKKNVSNFTSSQINTMNIYLESLYNFHDYKSKEGCIIPDLTVVFDVPVEEALKRVGLRAGKRECFEKEDFLQKVRLVTPYCIDYLKQKDSRNIEVINTVPSKDEVAKNLISIIKKNLK